MMGTVQGLDVTVYGREADGGLVLGRECGKDTLIQACDVELRRPLQKGKKPVLFEIDVGNANAKFAVCRGAEPLARWRIATDDRRTADEYMVWLDQLLRLEGLDRAEIDAVIISTVVPRPLHNLQLLADKYLARKDVA